MKILIVEDSRAVAAVMAARLNSLGHEVEIAENGAVGVEKFESGQPDLVFMDIEMPVMNGFEATNRIRALEALQPWAWTPIIFLTASDTAENLITAIEAGGDDFMSKSVPEPVLEAKMKAMARIAALRQRLSFANRKLEELASQDGLTGLANRRHMDLRTDLAWDEALRRTGSFALFMIDVDHFKRYNDHYGHQAGDDCLRAVAGALAYTVSATEVEGLTQNAFVARYGGEEFAVVVPAASEAAFKHLAVALIEAVRKLDLPHEKNDAGGRVSISAGGVRCAVAADKLVNLFRLADARLYRAKHDGRNRAVVSD
uniref:diguanylate cyclase n=1 Tax=Dechloromonas aromatica (strain RCB) TaxID=159087 RepID=Q47FG8_DECAR